jgi:hypothetical protein
MKCAVLEFRRERVTWPVDADSDDILEALADLRADLQCIEKAINAVESLAMARMGEDLRPERKPASRKKRAVASSRKRKARIVTFRRLPPPSSSEMAL